MAMFLAARAEDAKKRMVNELELELGKSCEGAWEGGEERRREKQSGCTGVARLNTAGPARRQAATQRGAQRSQSSAIIIQCLLCWLWGGQGG